MMMGGGLGGMGMPGMGGPGSDEPPAVATPTTTQIATPAATCTPIAKEQQAAAAAAAAATAAEKQPATTTTVVEAPRACDLAKQDAAHAPASDTVPRAEYDRVVALLTRTKEELEGARDFIRNVVAGGEQFLGGH